MNINVSIFLATADDAEAIADVITDASKDLTDKHGPGQWSAVATKRGILNSMSKARVLVAKVDNKVVGTLRLTASRPWVIDPAYFTPVHHPIYLVDMAVLPEYQRVGVGRALIEQAKAMAVTLTGDSIRLDAYEGVAGAGGFYEKCGFTEMGLILYKKVPHVYFEWLIENNT